MGKKNNQYQRYLDGYAMINKLEMNLDAIAREQAMSFGQYLILKQIIEEHCDEPTLLADTFGVSRPAMSRKLNSLFGTGKVIKKRNQTDADQRKVIIQATVAGQQALITLNAAYRQWLSTELPDGEDYQQLFDQFIQQTKPLAVGH
ncbi:helix-turn-helix domain-containing protein [Latilactobacillus fuchuensis]|uniref:Transcriptional regulator, MarR family n=2 Tax=Latilactobacillus fuchuensis TaxID=164393 RepID=A0A2N9DU98_9LACO|nr:hypothetical protein [Latilactobacillus fuchuensis]KRL61631.1 hypothetical protein FC69_GL000600 [Latilactobacillus fuchuensis DSM 14340 = JCM 11249]SPC37602.1 putative transcriptional regulator, MarR family [Latilactobacillus fuchuensis]